MTSNEMTLNEFKEVFSYLLDNNKQLEDKGLRPIAVGIEGEAGTDITIIDYIGTEDIGLLYLSKAITIESGKRINLTYK